MLCKYNNAYRRAISCFCFHIRNIYCQVCDFPDFASEQMMFLELSHLLISSIEGKTPKQLRPDDIGLVRGTPGFKEPETGLRVSESEGDQPTVLLTPPPDADATLSVGSASPPGSPPTKKGLVTSDAWKDSEKVRRIIRSDSQKKEKRQRTLSMKTRKHTQSFKEKYRLSGERPPSDMEGMLERKQELQSGGKKATIRSWKYYYTVLCGQLLAFFKDEQGEFG